MSRANVVLLAESDGRVFGLDIQLLFDILIQGFAVFLLFILLSYILIDPVRKVLEDRREKIKNDVESAASDRAEAAKLKAEYDAKIKKADDEAGEILSAARKKAVKNEENIIADANAEAARIISRANQEAELEKSKVKDEVKQEIISVATAMAGKFVAGSMDDSKQAALIDETLKEMGDDTWLNK
ncbi:MAG: F0F1 ATP synthase subunit B [Clostridium sp.]|nr:F0F1 ATP synthase subunit B [Clostridium sp.]MCM1171722.1 F0F1 ATP synthase subunit B [Clostridium sp.]MCM1207390.1 F0F1 ATP synthase subunit B [Ruminococcus sp.]